ncbi:hypothetical protein AK812_SmicGene6269 [Symbiodinium microadriaticum]|uniref:Uncharacterized protein n=1 Tax=Symbiodinium microadriaticum TaxID=2951 RepID=A0A1Q9ERK8_SYMMI|nr:hypothetical protein AK812_SmicGene6269 [Symbiodinium microadriaticum]
MAVFWGLECTFNGRPPGVPLPKSFDQDPIASTEEMTAPPPPANANGLQFASLYVGDLHPDVGETLIIRESYFKHDKKPSTIYGLSGSSLRNTSGPVLEAGCLMALSQWLCLTFLLWPRMGSAEKMRAAVVSNRSWDLQFHLEKVEVIDVVTCLQSR